MNFLFKPNVTNKKIETKFHYYVVLILLIFYSTLFKSYAQKVKYKSHLYSQSELIEYMPDSKRAVGTLPGIAAVDLGGNATYSIPIELPIGTNGVVPDLSISYSSSNSADVVGQGWGVTGLHRITRVKRDVYHDGIALGLKRLSNYTNPTTTNFNGDEFALDGARLVQTNNATATSGGVAHFETEKQSFADIYYSFTTETWTVVTLDGIRMEFGTDNDTYFSNFYDCTYNSDDHTGASGNPYPVNPIILFWRVNKITDPNGNFMEYYYKPSTSKDRTPILTKIKYTGFGQENNLVLPNNEINFYYEERFDNTTFYSRDGDCDSWNQNLLLTEIQINSDGKCFKKYNFEYAKDLLYSYLTDVTESVCSSDNGVSNSKNSTKFIYNDADLSGTSYSTNITMNSSLSFLNSVEVLSADIDGDGKSEVLMADLKRNANDIMYNVDDYLFDNSLLQWIKLHSQFAPGMDGDIDLVEEYNTDIRILKSNSLTNFTKTGTVYFPLNSRIAGTGDFDGDGRTDILVYQQGFSNELTGLTIYYGNNSTSMVPINQSLPPNTSSYNSPMLNVTKVSLGFDYGPLTHDLLDKSSHHVFKYKCNSFIIGDFDGDGRSEFITILADNATYLTKPGTQIVNALINTSTLSNGNNSFFNFKNSDQVQTTDLNGDGRNEISKIDGISYFGYHVSVVYNTNTSSYELINSTNTDYIFTWVTSFNSAGDFNGDGKTDCFIGASNYSTEIDFSGGHKKVAKTFLNINLNNSKGAADFNGDGNSDILDINGTAAEVYFSNGCSFPKVVTNLSPFNLGSGYNAEDFFTIGDFNGDGKQDILRYNLALNLKSLITKPSDFSSLATNFTSSNTFTIDYFGADNKERLLNTVINGLGSKVKYSYEKLNKTIQHI